MYPADNCNLTEFFEFHLYLSQNYSKRKWIHMEIQKILLNCSGQQGTFLKFCQGQPMSGTNATCDSRGKTIVCDNYQYLVCSSRFCQLIPNNPLQMTPIISDLVRNCMQARGHNEKSQMLLKIFPCGSQNIVQSR